MDRKEKKQLLVINPNIAKAIYIFLASEERRRVFLKKESLSILTTLFQIVAFQNGFDQPVLAGGLWELKSNTSGNHQIEQG